MLQRSKLDSKHVQALSFPSFATAQGVGECLKVCLYGGMDVKMNGCVENGSEWSNKVWTPFMLHTLPFIEEVHGNWGEHGVV